MGKVINNLKIKIKKMETRNVELTLEKAREWYKKGGDLKKVALQAFTEEELKGINFQGIICMNDVLTALNICVKEYINTIDMLKRHSKASAAAFKLNLIRKALNMGHEMDFQEGKIWYPYIYAVLSKNLYHNHVLEVAKVKIGCNTFILLGGNYTCGIYKGLSNFNHNNGVANSNANVGFLGCATEEIAQHMSIYFGKEIFEAKYGDTIDFEWV